jgi:putative MATE family efflux protein
MNAVMDRTVTAAEAPLPNPLVRAPILATLLRLALPNLAAMLVTALVAIAETAYVGILGTTPLAAIALVFPMVMLMQMLSAGAMGGGVSSAISRALGAGDKARADLLAMHALVIGAAAGLVFGVMFVTFARPILRGLGGGGAVLDHAVAYANVALTGTLAIWLTNTLASIVRGTGNMRVPSLALLGVALLQMALGGVFGLGLGPVPRFGLAGVALGLVVGYSAGTLFLLWFLYSGRLRVRLSLRGLSLRGEMFLDILKVGLVAAFSPLQSVLTVLILTAFVARFGTEALAGYGIGARLEFLLVPIAFAIGVACVPMVGMAIGADDVARARRVAWTGGAVSAVALGVISLGASLVPHLWSALFTADTAVRAAANSYLRFAGPGYAFVGLGLCLYFASQGAGKVLGPVLAATVRLGIVALGGAAMSWSGAPLWALFMLVGVSLTAYGLATAAAVYATPWGHRPRIQAAA